MDRVKAAYTEGTVSVVLNAILFCVKMWASVVSGSIALAADAWHTLSDSITSIIVVIAAKISTKEADKKHPFGYGRWEQIAALFIAVILGIIAFEFLTSSIKLLSLGEAGERANFGTVAIVVTIISIVVKEAMAQYAFYLGKKYDNASITADGWHHRGDVLSSIPVIVGILFAKDFWWTDGVLGIIVALMLFYATFGILKETIEKYLGEIPSKELINNIREELINLYESDLNIHHIHLHNYVRHKELTCHIRLDNNLSIESGHKTACEIEEMFESKFNITATIHIEPLKDEK